MAITKVQKVPRGHDVQGIRYLEISEGVQPPMEAIPAYYLPVLEEDKLLEVWKVLRAGTIVAFDKTALNSETEQLTNKKWLVPANGGSATTVTYSADDVDLVLDIDELNSGAETLVAASGAASKSIAANFPAGFAPYDYYSSAIEKLYMNFTIQHRVGFLTDYLVEVPLIFDTGATSATQGTIETGCLVQPGADGEPVFFDPSSDSVDQVCGRVVRVDPVGVVDALDKVMTVPGFRLPGTGTSGKKLHEDVYLDGTSTKVARMARINIICL